MKRFLILILLVLSTVYSFGENESVKPTYGVELDRRVSIAKIEDKMYFNVVVELNAADLVDWVDGVKVTVRDAETKKKIYNKRFSKSYLYAFSDGTIVVGKGNALTQVYLYKEDDKWYMSIRKKGIY